MVIDSYWWLLDASFQFLPAKAIFIIQLRLAKKDASWPGWPVQNMSGRFSNRNFGWRHGCQGWAIINAWRNIRDKPLGVADMAQPCAMRHAPAMRRGPSKCIPSLWWMRGQLRRRICVSSRHSKIWKKADCCSIGKGNPDREWCVVIVFSFFSFWVKSPFWIILVS